MDFNIINRLANEFAVEIADILNWAATLAFLDLGGKGNLAGITVGQQPRVIDSDSGAKEDDSKWHLQAQYRYKLSKGISLNPGIIAILNPENNADNDTVYVGTLRTIFEFLSLSLKNNA